jgi:hypothetical protein
VPVLRLRPSTIRRRDERCRTLLVKPRHRLSDSIEGPSRVRIRGGHLEGMSRIERRTTWNRSLNGTAIARFLTLAR